MHTLFNRSQPDAGALRDKERLRSSRNPLCIESKLLAQLRLASMLNEPVGDAKPFYPHVCDSFFFEEFQDCRTEASLQGVLFHSQEKAGSLCFCQNQSTVKGLYEAGIDYGSSYASYLQKFCRLQSRLD